MGGEREGSRKGRDCPVLGIPYNMLCGRKTAELPEIVDLQWITIRNLRAPHMATIFVTHPRLQGWNIAAAVHWPLSHAHLLNYA